MIELIIYYGCGGKSIVYLPEEYKYTPVDEIPLHILAKFGLIKTVEEMK